MTCISQNRAFWYRIPNSNPLDSDGDAMRRLIKHGSDLSKPMFIDFAVLVPDREIGLLFAGLASQLGFKTHFLLVFGKEGQRWKCYCSKTMVADYNDLIATQAQFEELGRPHGAKPDGWGNFGNAANWWSSVHCPFSFLRQLDNETRSQCLNRTVLTSHTSFSELSSTGTTARLNAAMTQP